MKALLSLVLLALFACAAMAAPNNNPNFVTRDEVQAMINAAIAPLQATITDLQTRVAILEEQTSQPTTNLPFDFMLGFSSAEITNNTLTFAQNIDVVPKEGFGFSEEWAYPKGAHCWGIMHLPTTDIVAFSIADFTADINWYNIPIDWLPTQSTPIPIEIHCFYAGKSWDLETTVTVPSETFYSTASIPATGELIEVTAPPGNYKVVASGTYHWGLADWAIADGSWWWENTWHKGGLSVNGLTPEWLALANDDNWITNGFSEKHIYKTNVISDGKIEFRINDSNYTDNSGFLTVEIYRIL